MGWADCVCEICPQKATALPANVHEAQRLI